LEERTGNEGIVDIELKTYQKPIVDKVLGNLKQGTNAVIAAAPGSGKTVMASYIVHTLKKTQI
jgi:superfamily II DNA or RNA helicase